MGVGGWGWKCGAGEQGAGSVLSGGPVSTRTSLGPISNQNREKTFNPIPKCRKYVIHRTQEGYETAPITRQELVLAHPENPNYKFWLIQKPQPTSSGSSRYPKLLVLAHPESPHDQFWLIKKPQTTSAGSSRNPNLLVLAHPVTPNH